MISEPRSGNGGPIRGAGGPHPDQGGRRAGHPGQGKNSSVAWWARSISGPGTIPKTTVTATQSPTATAVSAGTGTTSGAPTMAASAASGSGAASAAEAAEVARASSTVTGSASSSRAALRRVVAATDCFGAGPHRHRHRPVVDGAQVRRVRPGRSGQLGRADLAGSERLRRFRVGLRARHRARRGERGVHEDGHPEVEERGDRRGDHGDDGQRHRVGVDCGDDDLELRPEPGRERRAGLGQQQDGQRQGQQRLPLGQAAVGARCRGCRRPHDRAP